MISTEVQAVVDAAGPAAARVMGRVEERMGELASAHGEVLARYAGDTIAAGGKRLRPLLVCLAAGVPPPETDGLVRCAAAVELVHAATLVHDDVLDGAALRRGHPTVIAAAGRRIATATGDLLFSRAFAELAEGGSLAAVRVLSRACSELARGELMQRADAWRAVPVERYVQRCVLKTAALFRAACELGAFEAVAVVLSTASAAGGVRDSTGRVDARRLSADGLGWLRGAVDGLGSVEEAVDGSGEPGEASDRCDGRDSIRRSGGVLETLGRFGEQIGLAFQILDDVLDVSGPPERTGKARGADLLDGTVTLPLIVARRRDPWLAALDVRSIKTAAIAEDVCERIAATGALTDAKERALELVAAAKSELPALGARQRAALELVADGVVERYT
jgi:geranylgeranyl pyrophosphate synthase